VKETVGTYVEVILSGLKATNAEESACEAEHVNSSLIVSVLSGEETFNLVGAVKSLGVSNYATKKSYELVCVLSCVLSDEEVSTVGAVVAVV
jgi:hypothetical protein